jgi:DNA-binding transcriptional ArsR family regulator
MNTMTRQELTDKAKQLLRNQGFRDGEIHEAFWFKDYRVDVVGWNPERRVAVACGHCPARERKDLEKFFDEVICLPLQSQAKPVPVAPPVRNAGGKTRLVLVKDDWVVFDVPLSREGWPRGLLEDGPGDIEQDFEQFSRLFSALSHENRLRMMKLLMEDDNVTMGFADFMRDLDLNPKLVWENTRKLRESGLLEKSENGRYRCSDFGEASFIMFSLVLKRLREFFAEEGR